MLASAIDRLTVLDVSLCRNLHALAILCLAQPGLKKLLAARIPSMDTPTVAAIPSWFPDLEVLDVGYSRALTDEAFKRWTGEQCFQLKHLRLSGCIHLTDQTCWNLVGKIPMLEVLELASIGANFRDAGLVKLIESIPKLRKIDIEDAINITDRTIVSLTPSKRTRFSTLSAPLEHISLTNTPELSEAALVRLIKACPNLRVADCSNSPHVSDAVVKAFANNVWKNGTFGAELSIVDCRGVSRQTFRGESQTLAVRSILSLVFRVVWHVQNEARRTGLRFSVFPIFGFRSLTGTAKWTWGVR